MCLFKLCCLVFEFVFGGGDAIFNHQCCKHRVHLWHKARSATVWSRMLWQGVVSLGTAVSDFLLFWFPCDWTSLASGAAWNRTGLAWLIFRLSSTLETVQPVRLDGRKTQWAVSKSTALDSKHLIQNISDDDTRQCNMTNQRKDIFGLAEWARTINLEQFGCSLLVLKSKKFVGVETCNTNTLSLTPNKHIDSLVYRLPRLPPSQATPASHE